MLKSWTHIWLLRVMEKELSPQFSRQEMELPPTLPGMALVWEGCLDGLCAAKTAVPALETSPPEVVHV